MPEILPTARVGSGSKFVRVEVDYPPKSCLSALSFETKGIDHKVVTKHTKDDDVLKGEDEGHEGTLSVPIFGLLHR
jgi:hypothetical protein